MGKALGYVTITIQGLGKKPVIMQVGGKNIEDIIDDINKAVSGKAAASSTTTSLNGKADLTLLAPAYSNKSTYNEGDLVTYSKKLYRAKADIETAESWTSAHWEQVTLAEVIAALGA